MKTMLDFYKSRYGSAVKAQGDGFNGPCPLCGGETGKSDRFMILPDKSENLGHTCQLKNIMGIFFCRRCGVSGDSIEYLKKCEGLSFKDALHELGISESVQSHYRRKIAPTKQAEKNEYAPKERDLPSETWCQYADKILQEAKASIWDNKEALKWLATRGIDEAAILRYQIGHLNGENAKQGRYRARTALGLEAKTRQDGSTSNRIFIPRGIVIPSFHEGSLVSLRIRRPKVDTLPTATGYKPPKYMELEGSARMPLCLLPLDSVSKLIPFVVVEAEFDAMLCHYAVHEQLGVIALRSNRTKPCPFTHELLSNTPRILLAMDYEDSHAGIEGLEFWADTYPQIKRWPTPEGKDAGEAFGLGVDIKEWLRLGLPDSFKFKPIGEQLKKFTINNETECQETQKSSPSELEPPFHVNNTQANFLDGFDPSSTTDVQECGRMDTFLSGVNMLGGGATEELLLALKGACCDWRHVQSMTIKYVGNGMFEKNFDNCPKRYRDEQCVVSLEVFMKEEACLMRWWKDRIFKTTSYGDVMAIIKNLTQEYEE